MAEYQVKTCASVNAESVMKIKMKALLTKEQIATAGHEAAHAVAAYFLDLPFTAVHIIPDYENGSYGMVERARVAVYVTPEQLENRIIFCFAGIVAEARFTGRLLWRYGRQDLDDAFDLASLRHSSFANIDAFLRYLWVRTHEFVNRHWVVIEAVAAALKDRLRLTRDETESVIRGALSSEMPPLKTQEVVDEEVRKDIQKWFIRQGLRRIKKTTPETRPTIYLRWL